MAKAYRLRNRNCYQVKKALSCKTLVFFVFYNLAGCSAIAFESFEIGFEGGFVLDLQGAAE